MSDLRCDNGILFGVLDEGYIEVKCRSAYCGHAPGTVVIHRFDLATGELQYTSRFKDPVSKPRKESQA
jgi:hypothetical protein